MPKRVAEMTAVQVKRLGPGAHAVGGVAGLELRNAATGASSWVLRTRVGSKRREIGLGPYPEVNLAAARQKARETKAAIRDGRDPIAERRAARAALMAEQERITFTRAVEIYLAMKDHEFRNRKHAGQWRSTLYTYAVPVMGEVPVANVELRHVVSVLEPHWLTKTETMKRLRGRIESVLAWATVAGHRQGENPARWRGYLDQVLPAPGKVAKVEHLAAMHLDELPAFMALLRERGGTAARAVEFAILTAARSGEVRFATWAEIDLEARIWTIPADRMKAGREHRVPLADGAVELLERTGRHEGIELVFPGPRGGPLADMSLTAVLRRMDVDVTVHGFRSTFRDWCAERTAYPRDVAEMALAHKIENDVERAYRRGDLLEKRRRLMADWARFVESVEGGGAVVGLRARA